MVKGFISALVALSVAVTFVSAAPVAQSEGSGTPIDTVFLRRQASSGATDPVDTVFLRDAINPVDGTLVARDVIDGGSRVDTQWLKTPTGK